MTSHKPKRPTPAQLDWIEQNYCYNANTGMFFWLKEGGKGVSKHFAGDAISVKPNTEGYTKLFVSSADKDTRWVSASHVAFFLSRGFWPETPIDHINGNRTDNRIMNLRPVSLSQSSANRAGMAGKKLPKGVYQRSKNSFRCAIQHNKKRVWLGSFKTAEEAQRVYVAETLRLHREYAYEARP